LITVISNVFLNNNMVCLTVASYNTGVDESSSRPSFKAIVDDRTSTSADDFFAQIPERNRLQRNSSAHVRASTEINQILKTFSSDIDRLRALLRQSSLSVTGRELERQVL
jgi:hypothetical protein